MHGDGCCRVRPPRETSTRKREADVVGSSGGSFSGRGTTLSTGEDLKPGLLSMAAGGGLDGEILAFDVVVVYLVAGGGCLGSLVGCTGTLGSGSPYMRRSHASRARSRTPRHIRPRRPQPDAPVSAWHERNDIAMAHANGTINVVARR